MKFQCNGQQLRSAVTHAQSVTSKHAGLPILGSVLLGVSIEGGYVRATNLSIGVEIRFPAKKEQEGVVALSGALLAEVLSTVSSEELVTVSLEGTLITIQTQNSESTLKIYAPEDFPTLPSIKEGTTFSIPAKEFVEAVKSVTYAASSSDIKPEISSVYMYAEDTQLVVVSTDSFRLAEKKLQVPQIPTLTGVMIPVKNIGALLRIIGEYDGRVDIAVSETQISFSTQQSYCISRLVDGQYPDYRQIIPQTSVTEVIVLKQDLINALRILNVFADKFNQVDMTIDVAEKMCTMTSQNSDIGQNTTHLVSAITGEDIHIRFNARYMQDCLSAITADSVILALVAPNRPLLVRGMNANDFIYLIMPMNRCLGIFLLQLLYQRFQRSLLLGGSGVLRLAILGKPADVAYSDTHGVVTLAVGTHLFY